jgi:hypothetical protein
MAPVCYALQGAECAVCFDVDPWIRIWKFIQWQQTGYNKTRDYILLARQHNTG